MGLQKKECSNTPIHPLMTSSDFLVLITILLAIVSTAIANNKMIWIYKFSRFSIITYILIMIAINYFIFFPWYEQRGIYIERLMIKGSPMAATWVYTITCFHFSVDMENSNLQTFSFFKQSQVNQLL